MSITPRYATQSHIVLPGEAGAVSVTLGTDTSLPRRQPTQFTFPLAERVVAAAAEIVTD